MSHKSIVILTGAGISAESGLPTFRGNGDGLWHNMRPEDVATPEAFQANPTLVLNFYNERRGHYVQESIQPNPGHYALAKLQRQFSGEVFLVTQNIDGLHERAGSPEVCHMHGELTRMFCTSCLSRFAITGDILVTDPCTECGQTGGLRPDIVWFGEMPMHMETIHRALTHCDLFAAVGTSGCVYPAAGFVELARDHGAHTVELNLEPSEVQNHFAEHLHGRAAQTLPAWVDTLLASNR